MAYGAIIGAVASLASSFLGGSSGGGPNLGEYSGRLNELANKYILPFTDPGKWKLDVPAMAEEGIQFGLNNAPYINFQNMVQLQDLLSHALPGWQGMLSGAGAGLGNMRDILNQMKGPASQLLSGQVPQDVQDQIRRNAAYTALGSGAAGAGTGASGAITARDLGLTSLDLEQRGQSQMQNIFTGEANLMNQGTNLISFARNFLMPQPINPLSLLPLSQLVGAEQWSKEAVFKANEAAYTAKANAAAAGVGAPSQSLLSSAGGDIGALITALTRQNPQTGKSPFDSLFGMFGGGGDGGFNLNGFSGGGGATVGSLGSGGGATATEGGFSFF